MNTQERKAPTERRELLTTVVLASAYVAALAASWVHLAETFALLERPGRYWVGALAATAVDLGLGALALALADRARRGQPTGALRGAVVLFAGVSAMANLDHAMAVLLGQPATWADVGSLDALALARAVVFSATLPILVVTLAYVVDRMAADRADVSNEQDLPTGRRRARGQPLGERDRARADGQDLLVRAAHERPDATVGELAQAVGRPRQTVGRWAGELLERDTAGRWHVNGQEPGA